MGSQDVSKNLTPSSITNLQTLMGKDAQWRPHKRKQKSSEKYQASQYKTSAKSPMFSFSGEKDRKKLHHSQTRNSWKYSRKH